MNPTLKHVNHENINNNKILHSYKLHNGNRRGVNKNNLIKISTKSSNGGGKWITFGLLNSRSVRNKSVVLNDFVVDKKLDFLALTETWLTVNDESDITESLTPEGFTFTHTPRNSKNPGGGVGLLIKSQFKTKPIKSTTFKSFELLEIILKLEDKSIRICNIYRPPPSQKNGFTFNGFIDEFSEYLADLSTLHESVLIVGDFNIHIEDKSNADTAKYLDLLATFNFTQIVNKNTHIKGHCIDHVIIRQNDIIIQQPVIHDPGISDHFAVISKIFSQKPQSMAFP